MKTRNLLAAAAAGSLTFAAFLVGNGQAFAQEPSASPVPIVSPSPAPADMPGIEAMPGMDDGAVSRMMGEMMGASDSHMGGHPRVDEDRGWHDSRGMMDRGDTPLAEECRQMMGEMKAMMESMMSGSMMGGQPDGSGMGMDAPAPTPTPNPDAGASPSADGVDHAAHHASPPASPTA